MNLFRCEKRKIDLLLLVHDQSVIHIRIGFLLMMLTKTGPLTLSCLTVCIRKRREEKRSGQSHIIFGGFTHSFYVDTYQLKGGYKLQKSHIFSALGEL